MVTVTWRIGWQAEFLNIPCYACNRLKVIIHNYFVARRSGNGENHS
jgi:hypothetical protein